MVIPADFHSSIAHISGDPRLEVQRSVASMNRYYNGKVARLMQRLREADARGAQGAITMGRRIVAPGRTPEVGEAPSGGRTSHDPILLAVANAFGADITSYGTCADESMTAGVEG